jgi:hypothetical protein
LVPLGPASRRLGRRPRGGRRGPPGAGRPRRSAGACAGAGRARGISVLREPDQASRARMAPEGPQSGGSRVFPAGGPGGALPGRDRGVLARVGDGLGGNRGFRGTLNRLWGPCVGPGGAQSGPGGSWFLAGDEGANTTHLIFRGRRRRLGQYGGIGISRRMTCRMYRKEEIYTNTVKENAS